jgi:hypothetical protein
MIAVAPVASFMPKEIRAQPKTGWDLGFLKSVLCYLYPKEECRVVGQEVAR